MEQREILFRGKTESGEWLYGSLERRENVDYIGGYEVTPPTTLDPLGDTIWTTEKVVRESVGEYSGKTNGEKKRIFEGDIYKTNYYSGTPGVWNRIIGIVRFFDGKFVVEGINKYSGLRKELHSLGTILGNEIDNPELLTQ